MTVSGFAASRLVRNRPVRWIAIDLAFVLLATAQDGNRAASREMAEPDYSIAFANLGPLNTDIFLADPDGSNARPIASAQSSLCGIT